MQKFILFILLLGVVTCGLNAQFVYENRVYSPIVKTVTAHKTGDVLSESVIYLNKGDKLLLEFDELSEETHRYEYTLIHCNSDWTQSKLQQSDYIEGFENQSIEYFEHSFNTIQHYVHYSQTIPSLDMHITKSGNYIIKVFTEGNPNNVVFTKRIYVVEDKSNIELDIRQSSNAMLLKTHQEVNVKVDGKDGMFFPNATENMKVIVMQNGNDIMSHQLKIRGYSGNKTDFSFDMSNQFEAGNEFRFFDMTSLRKRYKNIAQIDFIDNQNHIYLITEKIKNRLPYSYEKDLNGDFYIRNEYDDYYATTSDYAWVHFSLSIPQSLEGNYYVVGQMNNWRMDSQSQMQFIDGKYRTAMYLKQGYYNYQIVYKHLNDNTYSFKQIEGNFAETNNKYTVIVYYHNFSDDYDEIIGYYSLEYNK